MAFAFVVQTKAFAENVLQTHLLPATLPVYEKSCTMQEVELRFPTLKDMMSFKQLSQVKELRIDTNERLLTGKFPESEVVVAKEQFKARSLN